MELGFEFRFFWFLFYCFVGCFLGKVFVELSNVVILIEGNKVNSDGI